MPPRPLIESPRKQAAVIAVVMFVVLACALAMTTLLTGTQRETVGLIEIQVPRRWQRTEASLTAPAIEEHVRFAPTQGNYRMSITQLAPVGVQSPLRVLALAKVLPSEADGLLLRDVRMQAVKVGPLRGLVYAGFARDRQQPQVVVLRQIAVLTEDGQRYWVISLSEISLAMTPIPVKQLPFNRDVFESMIASIEPRQMRDASDAELQAAGVAALAPPGFAARVRTDRRPDEPLSYLPTDDQPEVRLLRVRSQIDAGADKSHPALAPGSILGNLFLHHAGRVVAPQSDELWQGTLGDMPVWRVSLPNEPTNLARTIWYARLGAGRGLLVEANAESATMPAVTTAAEQLIQSLATRATNAQQTQAPAEASAAASTPEFIAALERGRVLADAQRQLSLQKLSPGWHYLLLEHQGTVIGCAVDEYLPSKGQGQATQYIGRGRVFLRGQPDRHKAWGCNHDGSSFDLRFRDASVDSQPRPIVTEHLSLSNGMLTMAKRVDDKPEFHWQMAVPPGYLLPIEDRYWPLDQMRTLLANGQTAIVWMHRSIMPPMPCWVEMVGNSQADGGRTLVRLRPMMSMESDLAEFTDEAGAGFCTAYHRQEFGGGQVTFRTVDEAGLLQVFPELAESLEIWKSHENPNDE